MKKVIVWFRNDLRLHDNEALTNAINTGAEIFPVYIFDDLQFNKKHQYGFEKTSSVRKQFILECLVELNKSLGALNSKLFVLSGNTGEIFEHLINSLGIDGVFANMERTQEEVDQQNAVEKTLWKHGKEIYLSRGKMLLHTHDLPFPVSQTPDTYASFRKEIDYVNIRACLPTLKSKINTPTINNFGTFDVIELTNVKHTSTIKAGEKAALKKLNNYITKQDKVNNSLLSAYISTGCLSAKKIFDTFSKQPNSVKKSKALKGLINGLYYRDYMRLLGKKHRNKLFKYNGIAAVKTTAEIVENATVQKFITAKTGVELIDALVIKLQTTGLLTNLERQLVSNYFVHVLQMDWRIGAAFFESYLLDYDPCSNYGNWQAVSCLLPDKKLHCQIELNKTIEKITEDNPDYKQWLDKV